MTSQHDLADQFATALALVGGTCTQTESIEECRLVVRNLIATVLVRPSETASNESSGTAPRIGISDAPLVQQVMSRILHSSGDDPFSLDVGITGVQWGIAETGTLVLYTKREYNRSLSLIPPVHIALLRASDIRPAMLDVFQDLRLPMTVPESRGGAVTFITGPSRTSDIELIPVVGVHGPQQLHVVIIHE